MPIHRNKKIEDCSRKRYVAYVEAGSRLTGACGGLGGLKGRRRQDRDAGLTRKISTE